MRLITFNGDRVGATDGQIVWDLTARIGAPSVKELIQGDLAQARAAATGQGDLTLDAITLELPLPDPSKIFCIGVNYMNRNAEYQDGTAAPTYPSLFMRSALSFAPHGAPILHPPESEQFD